MPMPSAKDDWEDAVGNVVGPKLQSVEEMQDIIYDLQDIATSSQLSLQQHPPISLSPPDVASDYFLSSNFIDQYTNEVKAKPPVTTDEEGIEGKEKEFDTLEGDPTDGEGSSVFSTCTSNWKAMAKDENKKIAKYGLAMIAKAFEVFKKRFLLGYDIGCMFEIMIKNSLLGSEFKKNNCQYCINAFHGYSHHYLCQLFHHPNVIEGVGLEDFETLK
ncbi:hypothetical protein C0995_008384 [Termitomyces sp. Mi166|nr:hypothetical protein C0995_008384 [Termitomyces sp. Mi166\